MAYIQGQRYCDECDRRTLHHKQAFSGGWGCLLTILTAGLFFPVWLILMVLAETKPWICQRCGEAHRKGTGWLGLLCLSVSFMLLLWLFSGDPIKCAMIVLGGPASFTTSR